MSQPTRYNFYATINQLPGGEESASVWAEIKDDGFYVQYHSYEALQLNYAALQAENERLRKAMEWQPVETAPKGVEVLVVEYGYIYIGIFDKDGYCDDTEGAGLDPSYWMPLPIFNEQAKGVQS